MLEGLRPGFERTAEEMVPGLAARGTFDGVADLAAAYPLRVFADAVGLSPEGRENLLVYGDMVFNVFGPRNRLFTESTAAAEPVRAWIAEHCQREALEKGGLGWVIYEAAAPAPEQHAQGPGEPALACRPRLTGLALRAGLCRRARMTRRSSSVVPPHTPQS